MAAAVWLTLGLVPLITTLGRLACCPEASGGRLLDPEWILFVMLLLYITFAAVDTAFAVRGWSWWYSRLSKTETVPGPVPKRGPGTFVLTTTLAGLAILLLEMAFEFRTHAGSGLALGVWVLVAIGTQWWVVAHRIEQLEQQCGVRYFWPREPLTWWQRGRVVQVPWNVEEAREP